MQHFTQNIVPSFKQYRTLKLALNIFGYHHAREAVFPPLHAMTYQQKYTNEINICFVEQQISIDLNN